MWFGGFSKLSRLFGGLFVVVFCFSGFFAVFMAFVFLLGGPSAEAGPFLRRSGYLYTRHLGFVGFTSAGGFVGFGDRFISGLAVSSH